MTDLDMIFFENVMPLTLFEIPSSGIGSLCRMVHDLLCTVKNTTFFCWQEQTRA